MVTGFHIGNPAELQRRGRIIPDLPLDPVFERDRAVPGPGCLDIHDLPLIKETIPDHFMGRPVPGLRFQEDLLSRTDNTVAVHTVEDHKIIPLLALRHGIIVGLFGFAFLHSGSCCRCSLRPLLRGIHYRCFLFRIILCRLFYGSILCRIILCRLFYDSILYRIILCHLFYGVTFCRYFLFRSTLRSLLHSGALCRYSLRLLRRLFLFLQNDSHGFVPAFFRIHGNSRK